MKKKLIDILPLRKFLSRIDRYLLKNHPAIWQTKGHYVLIYSLLINVPLFLFGYLVTNTNNLNVPPLQQLFLNNDNSFILVFGIAMLIVLYYILYVYEINKQQFDFSALLLSLLIYLICISSILLLNTTAYRLGTVYKSKGLMVQEDIDTLKANNFYMFGYLGKDSIEYRIESGYELFKEVVVFEDSVLNNRYDLSYLPNLNKNMMDDPWHRLNMANLSYMACPSYQLDLSYQQDFPHRFYLYTIWDISYRSYLSYILYISHTEQELTHFDEDKFSIALMKFQNTAKIKLSKDYNIGWDILNEISDKAMGRISNDLHMKIKLFNAKADSLEQKLPAYLGLKYNVKRVTNTLNMEGITFKHYPHLFHLEDIAWSTQHAHQYIDDGIWFKNSKMLLPLVLFFSLLLSSVRYFKIEELVIGGLLIALSLFVYSTLSNSENESAFKDLAKGLSYFHLYLVFALGSILIVIFSFFRQKKKILYNTFLNIALILLGILLSHILGLHITDKDFTANLPGFNFGLTENLVQLYFIPFVCTFVSLFAMWFIHQKPWAR